MNIYINLQGKKPAGTDKSFRNEGTNPSPKRWISATRQGAKKGGKQQLPDWEVFRGPRKHKKLQKQAKKNKRNGESKLKSQKGPCGMHQKMYPTGEKEREETKQRKTNQDKTKPMSQEP